MCESMQIDRFRGNIQRRIEINVSRPARSLSDPFKWNLLLYIYGELLKYPARSRNIISFRVCVYIISTRNVSLKILNLFFYSLRGRGDVQQAYRLGRYISRGTSAAEGGVLVYIIQYKY